MRKLWLRYFRFVLIFIVIFSIGLNGVVMLSAKIAFTNKSLSDPATALLSKPRDSFLDLQLPQSISSTEVQTGDFNLKSSGSWDTDKNTNLVNLNWESLGDKVSGYQVQSTTQFNSAHPLESSWDNISTNYNHKVKILNVYPYNGNFLKDWMDQTDSSTGQKVSMGLIDVSIVYIQDFNKNADSYLKNNGQYQYDGIYFGSSDANYEEDLNDDSYKAVANFAATGRSIILGHDTARAYAGHMSHFKKFGDKLGLIMGDAKPKNYFTTYGGDNYLGSSKVQFVTDGQLIQYPYKFKKGQEIEISPSHTVSQYFISDSNSSYGGGTRWMKFDPPFTDSGDPNRGPVNTSFMYDDHGKQIGDNNWYLVTKNNYAMIQTGHSTGQCTVSEAKIIANMIYYTSSLNTTTNGEDPSVKDTAAPNLPEVSVKENTADKIHVTVNATDNPTNYYYRVQAKEGSSYKYSSVIEQPVLSDLKGYIYEISNDQTNSVTVKKDSQGNVTNINLKIDDPTKSREKSIDSIDKYSNEYLHMVAVDRNNNVSAPVTYKISQLTDNDKIVKGAVWNDQNRDGVREKDDKSWEAGLPVYLFRQTDDNSLTPMAQTTTANDGTYQFAGLKLANYQVGIPSQKIPGYLPTVAGYDSDLLEQKPQELATLNDLPHLTTYSLTTCTDLTSSVSIASKNLGVSDQFNLIAFKQIPKSLDFGNLFIPYENSLLVESNKTNNSSSALEITDNRYGLQNDLSDYFMPYQVCVSLSPFTLDNDPNTVGLQQAQLGFQLESLNTSDFWIAPNNTNVSLYQQTLPIDSNLKTLTFSKIQLKVPPQAENSNVIQPGQYKANLTYSLTASLP